MNPNDTIRLLILNDSRDEAERLISMLRNAGRPSRAQHVESEEALVKLLEEQAWDLLIGLDSTANLPVATAIKQINRLGKDVPVILLSDREGSQPVVEGLKIGAADVVRLDEDQHLLLVITRELKNRQQRQQRRIADRRYKEAERRSQQLLDSSRDAIAYIQDGMYLYANESFAERFGYQDRDDIECMPVIDTIAEADQNKVKELLKEFTLKGDDAERVALEFNGITEEGGQVKVAVEVCRATYDEESCIQFISRAASAANSEELEEQISQIKQQDLVTGLYNRQHFVETLKNKVANADARTHALLVIEIDNFESQVQASVGMAGTDMVLSDLASVLRQHFGEDVLLARFADDAFAALINGTTADLAETQASELCRKVSDHIIDVDGKTLHVTLSVGLSLLNENTSSAEQLMEQALSAIDTVRAAHEAEGVGDGAKLYEPELSEDEARAANLGQLVQSAIKDNRFHLLYQPIISLRGSEEEYYEVLLRLRDDDGRDISPDEFFGAAAEMGALTKIDRWVILESIKQLAEHRSRGNKTKLIVNLSRQSLLDESLGPWLGVAFKTAKLSADSVVFQVPEDEMTDHLNAAKALADALKGIGGRLSISRFGCALNPFKTLEHVPVEFVKVDGSFTRDIQDNNESPEQLTGLIQQLHEQDKITIVPFVENANVLSTLWQAGVHYIQGHYLQAPTDEMDYDFNTEG